MSKDTWSWNDVPGGKPKTGAVRTTARARPAPQPAAPAAPAEDALAPILKEIATMAASVKELQAEIDRLRADIVAMPKVWAQTEASFRSEIKGLYALIETLRARPDNPDRDAEIDKLRKHITRIEGERDQAIAAADRLRKAKPAAPAGFTLPPVKDETRAWLGALRSERASTIDRVVAQILDDVAADDIEAHAAEAAE